MNDTTQSPPFEGWCILELMGHRRLAGYVRETTLAGVGVLRLDVPEDGDAAAATQFYPPSSLYCMTPVTEAVARSVARSNRPQPVQQWELRQIPASTDPDFERGGYDAEDDDDDEGLFTIERDFDRAQQEKSNGNP